LRIATGIGVAVAVALALVAVALAAGRPSRRDASRSLTPAAKNGEIALSLPAQGGSQVFAVNPDGTGLRQITHSKTMQPGSNGLSWSPDGRSLLYTVTLPHALDRIVRSRADGSGARLISPPCTGTCLGDDNPVFSPDGKKIAFERAFGPKNVNAPPTGIAIVTMNADGSDPTQLTPQKTPTTGAFQQPQWSPDGTKIAFVAANASGNQGAIEVMNADGTNIRRLTPFQIDTTNPRWSPDGTRILFSTYANPVQGESANLFTMRADGTDRVALTAYAGGTLQARADAWSPDGTQILFRRAAFSGTDTEVGGIYILDIHTKQIRQLIHLRLTSDALAPGAAWGRKPG
jgi:Tol biopolymer transport system component